MFLLCVKFEKGIKYAKHCHPFCNSNNRVRTPPGNPLIPWILEIFGQGLGFLEKQVFSPSDLEKSLNFSWLVTNQSSTFCFCHLLKYLIVLSSFSPSFLAVSYRGSHQLSMETSWSLFMLFVYWIVWAFTPNVGTLKNAQMTLKTPGKALEF